MSTNTLIWIGAGLVAIGIVGLFLMVLLPNRALTPVDSHELGDITERGLLRNIIGNL